MKSLFTAILAICALGVPVSSSPLRTASSTLSPTKRDADYSTVPTKAKHDHSGKDGDPQGKYFHESTFHPHYDGRFAERPLSYDEKRVHLTALIQTYLATMNEIGAETWIMHGSLLGWFWNRRVLPWDSDIDVQVSVDAMEHLSNYYNMTVHHFDIPDIPEGRSYMLEINPNWRNGSTADKLNMIDGRWVDTDTGLFIDITTLRPNITAQEEGHEGYMMCKDRHHYNFTDIFPLRDSVFEGIPVKIPYAYTYLLTEEYKRESLIETDFENHHFNPETMDWVPLSTTSGGKKKHKTDYKHADYGFRGSQAASRAALRKMFPSTPRESEVGKPPAPRRVVDYEKEEDEEED